MISFWEILTILAFLVGLLGLFARYDLLIRKLITIYILQMCS